MDIGAHIKTRYVFVSHPFLRQKTPQECQGVPFIGGAPAGAKCCGKRHEETHST